MRAILTYHSIDRSGSAISVDPDTFRQHVRWLASGAVAVVPLREIVEAPIDQDAVAVTFDDALESFGTVAAPLLLDAGLPVTAFVVTDRVGTTNQWEGGGHAAVPEIPLLGWDDLRAVARAGVELGAHTRTHPDLTRLTDTAIRAEMEGSVVRIEAETGHRPRAFAYPFGAHDDASVEAARELFDLACTAELEPLEGGTDPLRLPRLDMVYFRRPGLLEGWGTARFRRYLWLRQAGRRVRRLALAGGRS
jgi:peptidoglycan/xylan/chitin deacetylase (PgdA/CDA1 family)